MPRWIAIATVIVAAATVPAVPTAAQSGGSEKPEATEIGITPTEIRIAVIADDDNPLAPGLFKSSPAAVQAYAKFVNANGGLAGRKLVVDFIDSRLSADEARNAMIEACSNHFAVVGTAALFLNNMDDAINCADRAGAATGLPDLAIVTTELVHQCSPVTYSINPPQLDCATKDDSPQTWRGNQGSMKYYQRKIEKDLHGVYIYSNDIKSAAVAGRALAGTSQASGVEPDAEIGISARALQSAFTPVVQQMRDASSNYAFNAGPVTAMVSLRKEAKLQGLVGDEIVWDCMSNCYDEALIEQGGADVEGQYASIQHVPFNETKHNAALKAYVKFAGRDNVDGFGAYAWLAGMLLSDSVNAIVERDGVNGITRAGLLDELANTHAFDGDGMWGATDIGNRVPAGCFILMQVRDGEFVRVHPKKPGTFDCKKSNAVTFEADLLNS